MKYDKRTVLELHKGNVINLNQKPNVKLDVYFGAEESNEEYAAILIKADGTIEKPTEKDMNRISKIDERLIGKHISMYVSKVNEENK